jgi:hypothetical protein
MARFYKERLTKKGTRVRSAADMSEKERKVLQRKQWSAEDSNRVYDGSWI